MEGKLEGRRACFLTSMHMRPSGCSERVHTESGATTLPAPSLEVAVLGYSTAGFALLIVTALLLAP